MKPKMIFHHPLPVVPDGKSGSQVRPYNMVKAFQAIGYDVEMVTGYGKERKRAINKLKKNIKQGARYDFIYSESSTMPTLLTEKHHLPIYPNLDFSFFRWAKNNNLPIGLFYRDIYWRFDFYKKNVQWFKSCFSIPLYWYDWLTYKKYLDVLFLPTLNISEILPTKYDTSKVKALPPGSVIYNNKNDLINNEGKTINLLYIGGVLPPLYDLTPMFKTLQKIDKINSIKMNFCIRKQEWESIKNYYENNMVKEITVFHSYGDEVHSLYEHSNIFLDLREYHPYLEFAMPVKLIESICHGLPIIVFKGTEAARFIERENAGWVVKDIDEACDLIVKLVDNPRLFQEKVESVKAIRKKHTWEARARTVVDLLKRSV